MRAINVMWIPSQATPEKGERIIAVASAALIADYRAFLAAS